MWIALHATHRHVRTNTIARCGRARMPRPAARRFFPFHRSQNKCFCRWQWKFKIYIPGGRIRVPDVRAGQRYRLREKACAPSASVFARRKFPCDTARRRRNQRILRAKNTSSSARNPDPVNDRKSKAGPAHGRETQTGLRRVKTGMRP